MQPMRIHHRQFQSRMWHLRGWMHPNATSTPIKKPLHQSLSFLTTMRRQRTHGTRTKELTDIPCAHELHFRNHKMWQEGDNKERTMDISRHNTPPRKLFSPHMSTTCMDQMERKKPSMQSSSAVIENYGSEVQAMSGTD